jgi:hypothetical protein
VIGERDPERLTWKETRVPTVVNHNFFPLYASAKTLTRSEGTGSAGSQIIRVHTFFSITSVSQGIFGIFQRADNSFINCVLRTIFRGISRRKVDPPLKFALARHLN